jgi:diguanylate cyclase (GGDEF)-like protein
MMAWFNVFSCILFAGNLVINRKGYLGLAYHLAIMEITVHAALASMCLGWNSNFCFYSIAICSVIMFSTFLTTSVKVAEVLITSLVSIAGYVYLMNYSSIYTINETIIAVTGLINTVVIISLLTSIFYKFYKETEELNNKLKAVAETDGLTGVYNRRFFNEYFAIELKKIVGELSYPGILKEQRNFGLVMIDVDNFKNINDTYGHGAGDAVLVQVVNVIKRTVFSRDVMFRYGGEEFVVMFTKADKDGAIKTSEKIRTEIERESFVFNDEIRNGKLTISAGFACFDEVMKETNPNCLLTLADQRLLRAKAEGKNRVIYS